ncbi:DUF4118 domain-containing protein [Pseudomonas sp. YJ42]|uniref:DUF4118 domain-containing protein n=1 Tax=Pseudomonas sp. YJ42 TaxID=3392115 RepID=UPI0039A2748D
MSDAPHADALLDDQPHQGQGRLKVFLGAAPGVGKTYAMLQAAQRQLRLGRQVLAGVVESHGRADTEALRVGVPEQPLTRSDYRGVTLDEMDLEGLLQMRPGLVLVDELAHSNVPGSRHSKRWQDVLELLEAGIDVYTTVNVQHLESLNDQVRTITGVQVRETVPDWVLHNADEILLIDLPPRELLERLREGKVYVPEQARAAIDAFFTQTNLTALRELAMQTAAARVDADLLRRSRSLGETAPVMRGRLLVGIDGDASAEGLVRHAARVAERRHLPWSVVHVSNGTSRGEMQLGFLQSAQQLAERLGGEVVELRGEHIARTLLEHATERLATVMLVGSSQGMRKAWSLWSRRTIAEQLIRAGQGLEVSVLSQQPVHAMSTAATKVAFDWRNYLLAAMATGVATAVALLLSRYLELPNVSLVFLSAVLVVAVRSSLGPALACAGASFLLYDFLFIPPTFTFIVARQEDVLTLLFFLLMAVLTGNLASRQRRQYQALRQTQTETAALLNLSRQLSAATDVQAVGVAAVRQLQQLRGVQAVVVTRGKDAQWLFNGDMQVLAEQEQAAADWAWRRGQPAGQGTDTLPSGHWWWLPLNGETRTLGLLGIRQTHAGRPQTRRLIAALAHPLAQALQRAMLAEELEAARLHGQTEELRSALLASVSHDLRTPLTAMRGSIDSLATLGGSMSEADRQELLDATRDEAERLDRYIQNLLDMTRLGHGGLKLIRDWTTPGDIVASALQRLQRVLAELKLEVSIPDSLPLLYVHPALIEQALVNVLENAARFSPPQGRLRVEVEVDADHLRFIVSDEGPGVPEAERVRIFDMFYTAARGDRGGPGTGLGLAICQGMIGAHGGRVSVGDGLDGHGASVVLELPLQPQPEFEKDRS